MYEQVEKSKSKAVTEPTRTNRRNNQLKCTEKNNKLPIWPSSLEPTQLLKESILVNYMKDVKDPNVDRLKYWNKQGIFDSRGHAPDIKKLMSEYNLISKNVGKYEEIHKELPPDIVKKYNVQKACVLQALILTKKEVFGVKSAKDLHDVIFEKYPEFQQYSEDSVMVKLFEKAGLIKITINDGTTIEDIRAKDGDGQYLVSVQGSAEDHVVVWDRDKDDWYEYKQTGSGSGYQSYTASGKSNVRFLFKVE